MDNTAIGVNMSPSILAALLTTIAAGVVTVVAGSEYLSRTALKQVQEDQQNIDQELAISPRGLT
jgi:hypothetical protein